MFENEYEVWKIMYGVEFKQVFKVLVEPFYFCPPCNPKATNSLSPLKTKL